MKESTICALGFFDGVHIGHRALLQTCLNAAEAAGCQAAAVTFQSHPDTLVLGTTPPLINLPRDRSRLLKYYGMDQVIELPFDREMCAMHWEKFLDMVRQRYGAVGFVCGEDFIFGHRGYGNAQSLSDYCREHGLYSAVVPEQYLDGVRISSTYIRQQIQEGQVAEATRFLGHPHIFSGKVCHGQQLGRTLGIPTANLPMPDGILVPRLGVYACRGMVEGKVYPVVTNVGTRPTVNGRGIVVEAWILGFQGDLYDREIQLEYHKFLRPEEKFDSLEALKAAILRDAQQTRQLLG